MTRKFFGIFLSAALAVTSIGVAPAQAGDRELRRALAGVAALAIIGSAISQSQAQDRGRHNTYNRHGNRPRAHQPRAHQPRHRARAIPAHCLVNTRINNRPARGFGARCAQRSVRGHLPQNCVRRTSVQRGPRL